MCGIAGTFLTDAAGAFDIAQELAAMSARLASRGPDGTGTWQPTDGRVGFVHRRLAIIDLSADGAQPMRDPDTGNVIVFNGEIYNYRALRTELEAGGARFRSQSDTEVLLHLYRRDGDALCDRLRGMFAFAIHDGRDGSLLLARDHFGIKPLYVADDGRTVRFASQVKALLASAAVDDTPDAAGHAGFFLLGHVPEPFTCYRGTAPFPAGETLRIGRDGRRHRRRFFDLTDELSGPVAPASLSAREVRHGRERLQAALAESVAHHLVADVPVGVFLSAGLDSGTIASLAAAASPTPVNSLTLAFDEFSGTPADEGPLAAAIARHCGLVHAEERVPRSAFLEARDGLFAAMDQPSIDGLNSYLVSAAAGRAGWKVALSGLGGDELLAGYPSFRQIPKAVQRIGGLARHGWLRRPLDQLSQTLPKLGLPPKYGDMVALGGTWGGAYLLRRALFLPRDLPGILGPEMAAEGLERLALADRLEATVTGIEHDRFRVTALETAWYMRNQLLRDSDWASMAHGVELRVPLVDIALFRTVVELVRSGHGCTKADLARAAVPALPIEVTNRPKTGFGVPTREWLGGGAAQARGLGGGSRRWAHDVWRAWAPAVAAGSLAQLPRADNAVPCLAAQ
jgi:asparagine synthase (glutamine-hydrolysing)